MILVTAGNNIFYLAGIWKHWLHIENFMAEKTIKRRKIECLQRLKLAE